MPEQSLTYMGVMSDYRSSKRDGLAARMADAQHTAAMHAAHGRLCVCCTKCGRCKPAKLRKPTVEELEQIDRLKHRR